MNPAEIRIIKLACISCGSTLDIASGMQRLACAHCGTQQVVERTGSSIHLREVAETLSQVRVNTDKTAAELAIARLTKELNDLRLQRSEHEQGWMYAKHRKALEWNALRQKRKHVVTGVVVGAALLALIPTVLLIKLAVGIFSVFSPGAGSIAGVATFLLGCGSGALIGFKMMNSYEQYNPQILNAEYKAEMDTLSAQLIRDLSEFDKRIAFLNTRLQENYRIANS